MKKKNFAMMEIGSGTIDSIIIKMATTITGKKIKYPYRLQQLIKDIPTITAIQLSVGGIYGNES